MVLLIGGAISWGNVSAKLDEHYRTIGSIQTRIDTMDKTMRLMRDQQVRTDTELKIRQADEFAPFDPRRDHDYTVRSHQ